MGAAAQLTTMTGQDDSPRDSRERILQALAPAQGGLTVDALARVIGISRSGVRQHLTALERDGLITRAASRPSGGRPELQFVLTEAGRENFPRQYSWFAELLLQMLSGIMPPAEIDRRLGELGRSVGSGLSGTAAGTPVAERVAAVVARMAALGYDARAVAGREGWSIEAGNCVFHKLAQKHPEICRFDIAMLEAGTGQRVEHGECMARGDSICRFRLRKSA
jgi:predicted ArsR family transcriptional regulator